MRWIQMLRLRLRALFHSSAADRELQEELDAHLANLIGEHIAAGLTPAAARTAALREFGGLPQAAEACREARGISWISHLFQDLRYGTRLLTRSPAFAAAAILVVALGVASSTAMFSVVYGVILKPLPFGEPGRLVHLWSTAVRLGLPRAFVGAANARDWRAQNHVFTDIALVRNIGNFNLVGQGEPERLIGARVSANLFSILQVRPLIGRTFLAEENTPGRDHVVLLGYRLWQRRFGGNSGVVGQKILLNGDLHEIVGVMRADFTYPGREFEMWVPLTINPDDYATRLNYGFIGVARLRPGVTLEQARSEMGVISERLARQYPAANDGVGVDVEPMLDDTVAPVKTPLFVLLGAVGAILLIGCANLANLLLARALVRQRELAVRAALGASRGRLIAQSIAELMPMLAAGGALGLVAAGWALDTVVPLLPADVPRAEDIGIHIPVLGASLATLAAIALLTGVWPAIEASRGGLAQSAADLSRSTTGAPRRTRMRDLLVVAQIAATMVLLVAALLLAWSFVELRHVDAGFQPEGVLSLHVAIPRAKYGRDAQVADFCGRVLERVQALPDVVAAGMISRLPLAGGVATAPIVFEGSAAGPGETINTDVRSASPGYFRALSIPLIRGRAFTEEDREDAPPVAVIDERLLPAAGVDPIGRRFRIAVSGTPWITVVGVVGHIHHERLEEDSRPQVYWNYRQRAQDRMALVVKTGGEPAALTRSIAGIIRSIDPEQPVYDVLPMTAVVGRSLARRWLQTTLLGSFAAVALLLASVGVYGVIAYTVGQRLREFGIRMALGATRRDIVRMVVGRGAVLFAAGACLGLAGAALGVRVLATMLYHVGTFDVTSFLTATLLLFVVGLAACYIPARRAARIDPTVALRAE